MAETLRWPSSLKKQANQIHRREASANFFSHRTIVFGLLTGAFLFILFQQSLGNTALGLFLSLSWILMVAVVVLGSKMFSVNFESSKLHKGFTGELFVAHELDKLPDGWFIINDIVIKGSQIDHIAVGPTGLYCLETKSWNNAGCDENGVWFRFHLGHWAPMDKSPAVQNINHILAVKKFLAERIGFDLRLVSVVVLANPSGKFNIKDRTVQPGDTIICLPSELHQILVNDNRNVLSPDMVKNIARTLTNRSV